MKFKNVALILIAVIITSLFPAAASAAGINAYAEIAAGTFSISSDSSKFDVYETNLVGMKARNLTDYICFEDVDFKDLTPYAVVTISATSDAYAEGNVFTIKLDSPDNEAVATVYVTEIGGWGAMLENVGSITTEITGVHDVYISTNQPNDLQGFYFIGKNVGDIVYKPYSAEGIYSDVGGTKYEREITLLSGLGIMNAYEYDKFLPELPVTRAEFSQFASGLLVDEIPFDSTVIFSDVASDNKYRDAINFLYNKGIVEGSDNKTFSPFSFITARDAAIMILRILGYPQLNIADEAYMNKASELELLSGISPEDYLRRETAAKLLYTALDSEYVVISDIRNGEPAYSYETGILEKTRKIKKGKDIVNASAFGGVIPGVESMKGSTYIGDKFLECGNVSIENYLGVKCDYFYKNDNNTSTLLSIFPSNGVEQKILDTHTVEFVSVENDSVSYYNEKNKLVNENIPVSASWIYNNRPLTKDISEIVSADSLNGRIRLVNNGQGWETVFVENYRNIKIRSYDDNDKVIYDDLSGKAIDLSGCSELMFSDGTSILLPRQITQGMLAELYLSDDGQIAAILTGESVVSGIAEEIFTDDKVLIGDIYYNTAKEFKDNIILGASAQFYLNRHGDIVYIKIDGNTKLVGIFNKVKEDDGGAAIISIMTATNTVFDFKIADKIYIDGNRVDNDYNNVSSSLNASLRFTPVLYTVNSSGRLNMIDSQEDGALNSKDTLTLLKPASSTQYSYYKYTGNFVSAASFTLDCPVKNDAHILLLNSANAQSGKCFIGSLSSYYSYYDHQFAFYSTQRDKKIADIVHCSNYSEHDRIEYNFVDHVRTTIGDDGCTVGATIYFKGKGGSATYWVSSENETQYKYAQALKKGDYVRIETNFDNDVESIVVGLFADGNSSNSAGQPAEISKFKGLYSTAPLSNSNSKMIYGTVQSIDNDEGYIEIIPFGSENPYWCKVSGNILLKINDKEVQTGQPVSDINPEDTVLVRYQYGNLVLVALYEK